MPVRAPKRVERLTQIERLTPFGLCLLGLTAAFLQGTAARAELATQLPVTVPIAPPTPADLATFDRVVQRATGDRLSQVSFGEIVQAIATEFLGAPYRAGLLDRFGQETLLTSLQEFDCVLFVETVLAIARNIALEDTSFESFAGHIQTQRYRDGKIDGYCSRLHYFSDWMADNQERGNLRDLAPELGGMPLQKSLTFMSRHTEYYPQLANSAANIRCIAEREAELQHLSLAYIPSDRIRESYAQIQPGDIFALVTSLEGLDVIHTGLTYRTETGIAAIHASPSGEVKISSDLQAYVQQAETAIGILLARPSDPRQPTAVR